LEEQALVEGLRQRDEEAVRAYLQGYRSLFHHCIGHFESDPITREDLFQDLVWYVLERLDKDSYDPTKGSFGTWVYRVAWCRCVDLKRQQNARRRVRMVTIGEDLPERTDPRPGPREQADESEIGGLVREAMSKLDREEQSLLDLRYVDGRVLSEIADELGISIEQAKYRLKRAASSLRRALLNEVQRQEAVE
jgi:RNA polymerase sigma-70 factor (ECF subfamily)